MTSTDILLGLVVDKSGSMGPLRQATIDGVNQLVADQAAQEGQALISLTLFDTVFDVRHVAVDAREFPPLTPATYTTGGMTALYDAVGATVKGLEAWLAGHPAFDGTVKIAIFTDGQENESKQWHIRQPRSLEDVFELNNLMEWKQGEGWEFLFLGAGGSAWTEAQKWGLQDAAVFQYAATPAASATVYRGVSETLTGSRMMSKSFAEVATSNNAMLSSTVNRGEDTSSLVDDPTP